MIRKEKGITLIALVVTIVVLLILAGVSISLVLGDNGIISKSKEARDKYAQAQENEQASMGEVSDWINEQVGGNGNGGEQLPFTDETKPYLPSDDFSHLEGTDLSNGLVIQDSQGNQYVWVEVPKTATVYPIAGLTITNFTDEEYTKIENDLHTYTMTYRKNSSGTETSYTDTYKEDSTTGWFADEDAYNTAKKNMLKSVYQNGGFWIGKYEAGISTPRTASGAATTTPLSKANLYPYNYVTRTQAKVLAEQVLGTSGEHTSSLMFGIQWDLVLKYLETKGATQDELKGTTTGSTNWGNYADAEIPITNTNAKYAILNQSSYELGTWNSVPANYTKPNSGTESWVLLSTGANETRNSKQHICDLAGNVCEWTLEYTSSTSNPCALRGGYYYNSGSYRPASYRYGGITTDSNHHYGFRVSLY